MVSEYKANEQIRSPQVRVIDADGSQMGVMNTREALNRARDAGLDLVEVVATATPPVCKIVDFGKFKYELVQKEKEQARKARANQVETKEIQLRPVTDDNDVKIKTRKAQDFLAEGHRVKLVIKFKGREITHLEMGQQMIQRVLGSLTDYKTDKPVEVSGKQITVTLAPQPKKATVETNQLAAA